MSNNRRQGDSCIEKQSWSSHSAAVMQDEVNVAWELSKENVLPLSRGRGTDSIRCAFAPVPACPFSSGLEAKQGKLEEDLLECRDGAKTKPAEVLATLKRRYEPLIAEQAVRGEGDIALASQEDPLAPWLEYIKAVQDNLPMDQREQFDLLERCSRQFRDEERYKNDLRYLKVWMAYADRLSNPDDLFNFLYKKRIGVKHAPFWVNWATVSEQAGKYPFVEKLYVKAIDRLAQPGDMVKKRYHEFLRRMRRFWINRQLEEGAEEGTVEEVPDEEEGRRRVLQSLSISVAERQRQPYVPHESSRGSITGLVARGDSNAEAVESRNDKRFGSATRAQLDRTEVTVFVEAEFEAGVSATSKWERADQAGGILDDRSGGWRDYGTRNSRDRENVAEPSRWTEVGLRQRVGATDALVEGGSNRLGRLKADFSVFVDEEDGDKDETGARGSSCIAPESATVGSSKNKDGDLLARGDARRRFQEAKGNSMLLSSVDKLGGELEEEEQVEEVRERHVKLLARQYAVEHEADKCVPAGRSDDVAPPGIQECSASTSAQMLPARLQHDGYGENDACFDFAEGNSRLNKDHQQGGTFRDHDEVDSSQGGTLRSRANRGRGSQKEAIGLNGELDSLDVRQKSRAAVYAEDAGRCIPEPLAATLSAGGDKAADFIHLTDVLCGINSSRRVNQRRLTSDTIVKLTCNGGAFDGGNDALRDGRMFVGDRGRRVEAKCGGIQRRLSPAHSSGSSSCSTLLTSDVASGEVTGNEGIGGPRQEMEKLEEDKSRIQHTIEDVTINTRLALKTVDEWFAGPVEESCEYGEGIGSEGDDAEALSKREMERFKFFFDPDGSIGNSMLRELEGRSSDPPDGNVIAGADIILGCGFPSPEDNLEDQENTTYGANPHARSVNDIDVEGSVLRELEVPATLASGSTREDDDEDEGSLDFTPDPSCASSTIGEQDPNCGNPVAIKGRCQQRRRPRSDCISFGRDGRACYEIISEAVGSGGNDGADLGRQRPVHVVQAQVLNVQPSDMIESDGGNISDGKRGGTFQHAFGIRSNKSDLRAWPRVDCHESGANNIGGAHEEDERQQGVVSSTCERLYPGTSHCRSETPQHTEISVVRLRQMGRQRTTNAEVLRRAGIRPRWPPVPSSCQRQLEGKVSGKSNEDIDQDGFHTGNAPCITPTTESFAVFQDDCGGDADDAAEHPVGHVAGGERSGVSPARRKTPNTAKPALGFTIFRDTTEEDDAVDEVDEALLYTYRPVETGPDFCMLDDIITDGDDPGAKCSKVENCEEIVRRCRRRCETADGGHGYRQGGNDLVVRRRGNKKPPVPILATKGQRNDGKDDGDDANALVGFSEAGLPSVIAVSVVEPPAGDRREGRVSAKDGDFPPTLPSRGDFEPVVLAESRHGEPTTGSSATLGEFAAMQGPSASLLLAHGKESERRNDTTVWTIEESSSAMPVERNRWTKSLHGETLAFDLSRTLESDSHVEHDGSSNISASYTYFSDLSVRRSPSSPASFQEHKDGVNFKSVSSTSSKCASGSHCGGQRPASINSHYAPVLEAPLESGRGRSGPAETPMAVAHNSLNGCSTINHSAMGSARSSLTTGDPVRSGLLDVHGGLSRRGAWGDGVESLRSGGSGGFTGMKGTSLRFCSSWTSGCPQSDRLRDDSTSPEDDVSTD